MKRLILIFMCVSTLLSSCEKDKGTESDNSSKCTLSSIDLGNGESFELGYDEQGRVNIIKLFGYDSPYEEHIEYFNDKIVMKQFADLRLQETVILQLSNGLITSGDNYKYTYENGYLASIHSGNSNNKITFTYENGNLVKMPGWYPGLAPHTFSYDTTQPYIPFSLVFMRDAEIFVEPYEQILYETGYFGKISKNRVIGIDSKPVNYSFDTKGNLSLINIQNRRDGDKTISYVYSCK